MKLLKIYFALIIFFLLPKISVATHVRAGEIVAKKIGGGASTRYSFTFYLYQNSTPGAADQKDATIYFGDGTSQKVNKISRPLNSDTEELTFNFTHTYDNPGLYTVYTKVDNRNAGILNIDDSDKVNFYIETQILIDPLLGQNGTPIMKFPPIDKGAINQTFTHNPGAFDADGDSLVYELIVPKFLPENAETAREVPGHRLLNNPLFSTQFCNSNLSINPNNGTITWEKPCIKGEFNIAFKITEYRNGIQIGYLTRDMQIDIIESNNKKPVLTLPKDTCVQAGRLLLGTITGSDPDFIDDINIKYSGASFDVPSNPAFLNSFINPINNPSKIFFNWQTTCEHIRQEEYNNTFKIDDNKPSNLTLVEFKTWAIKVNGPSISGFNATPSNNEILLNWNLYNCNASGNAKINVMRKSCNNSTFSGSACNTGLDVAAGFMNIAQLNGNAVFFRDTAVTHGIEYCYYVYAEHQKIGKGIGKPSVMNCSQLNNDITYITNVSVTGTSETLGKINIKWTKPKVELMTLDVAPYIYELWRKSSNVNPILVTTFSGISDTTYTDINLNTKEIQYEYQVIYKYGQNLLVKNTTSWASSVKLLAFPNNKKIVLSWNSLTPWQNTYPTKIYKLNTNTGFFLLIASTTGKSFEDIGQNTEPLVNGQSYSYYVSTNGKQSVGCQNITTSGFVLDSLINASQIVRGVIPKDSVPPCEPILNLNTFNCDNFDEKITLNWKLNILPNCESTILGYHLHYSSKSENPTFNLLKTFNTNENNYLDIDNKAFEGCYKIKTFRNLENGNLIESNFSNIVCVNVSNCENLPYFDFPNVFTPEPKDGFNDILVPKPTPRLVQSLNFQVFNRWGTKIYSTNDININWDGNGSPDGIYYCYAKVTYFSGKQEEFKRWVQLLR